MSTPFDPIKAAREELAGLSDLHQRLLQRARGDEEALALAETQLNDTRKIIGYVRIGMDALRTKIAALEVAAQR